MVKIKDYTSIGLSKDTKNKLRELKKYPRETDEETLLRLIKQEVEKKKNVI